MDRDEPIVHLVGARCERIDLPMKFRITEARFERADEDLWLEDETGRKVIVRDFFAVETPPELHSADGDMVPGDLARILVDLSGRAVSVLLATQGSHSASA